MYASFINQFINLSHYAFSFVLLFLIWPYFMFKKEDLPLLDRFFTGFIKMVFIIIVTGYLLVVLKLFELIALAAIFLLISARKLLFYKSPHHKEDAFNSIIVWVYDVIDGVIHPVRLIKNRLLIQKNYWSGILYNIFGSFQRISETLLLISVFAYTAYLRFYDACVHAAPAMSDAYVTLEWMKLVNRRILFDNQLANGAYVHGIYPRGFHIYLATIGKFAAIDPLYILKYSGPLNGVLTALGLYFVLSRITKRRIPGIAAVIIFGLLGSYIMGGDWIRQSSTNSQEFAFVFIIPVLYFYYKFLESHKKNDLWTAAAGTAVVGLVHSLAFALLGLGMGVIILCALVTDFKGSWRKIPVICLSGIMSAVMSVLPLGIGLLLGYHIHSSSESFLVRKASNVTSPALTFFDYAALASAALLVFFFIFNLKRKKDMLPVLFCAAMGAGTFGLYYWGAVLTGSELVSARSGVLWALIIPFCIGMGWYIAGGLIAPIYKHGVIETFIYLCLVAAIGLYLRPSPIIPYKMEYDSSVEQYLRISSMYRPTEWYIVSQEEGYSLVLGNGYHMLMKEFLDRYNPSVKRLEINENGKQIVLSHDIFIFHEKKVYKVDKTNSVYKDEEPIYERREKENTQLEEWLKMYRSTHDNAEIFYEDDNLQVVHINQPPTKNEQFSDIWDK